MMFLLIKILFPTIFLPFYFAKFLSFTIFIFCNLFLYSIIMSLSNLDEIDDEFDESLEFDPFVSKI